MSGSPDQKRLLAVFDFDGTITWKDSFVPFLRFSFGTPVFAARMLRMVIPSVRFMTGRISRDDLKAILVRTFLSGVKEAWIEERANAFCKARWPSLMKPESLAEIERQLAAGAEVTICSASPALVLRPFAERLGIKLIATRLEVVGGMLTGRIVGRNCRCDEKVRRLQAIYLDRHEYIVHAWGDSRGDREMLDSADVAHWVSGPK